MKIVTCTFFTIIAWTLVVGQDFDIPPVRAHHELVYDESTQSVLMTGGSTPLNGGQSFKFYNDLWYFKNGAWKKSGNAGDERSGMRLAFDSKRNKIFSFGGFNGESRSELRVLENGEWKILSALPEMKAAEPGFVYDSHRDRLIVFGGSAGRGQVGSTTYEWDGKSWTTLSGDGPQPRQSFAMVYDSKRKKTIVFGGMGPNPQSASADTWEFDGSLWKKVAEQGPGPRLSPGFAYDSKRGLFLIFGGMVEGKMVSDLWAWNGSEWKKLADTGPSPRAMGYMTYDRNRDRVVLFGGRIGWPNDVNDTWEWDGVKWQEVKGK